jgi:hypothetical protein
MRYPRPKSDCQRQGGKLGRKKLALAEIRFNINKWLEEMQ